jgi:peptidoglycan/LPS O-acetylase OafA/YrhL
MNTTHLHLLLNHFPIIGTLIGTGLLLWAIIKKQDNGKLISSALLILMALIAIPVYLTGEPAEESVEKLAGVSETMIELHEDAATIAMWLMGIAALFAFAAIVAQLRKHKSAKQLFLGTFIFSAICFAAMARTGYYGGQIRHTEIRSDASAGQQNEKETQKKNELKKDDD